MEKGKYIKKADIVLAVVLVILCVISSVGAYRNGEEGKQIKITVDGRLYGIYSLEKERNIKIESDYGTNIVTISKGKALMTEASCPDRYCMNQYKKSGGIHSSEQSIICLPNHVAVSIEESSVSHHNSSSGHSESKSAKNEKNSPFNDIDMVSGTPSQKGES